MAPVRINTRQTNDRPKTDSLNHLESVHPVMSRSSTGETPWMIVVTAAGVGIAGLFVGLLLGVAALGLLSTIVPLDGQSPLSTAVAMVAQGLGLVVVAAIYLARKDLPWSYLRVDWPSIRDIGWAIAATLALFGVLAGMLFVIQQIGLEAAGHSVTEAANENPELLLPLIPLSVVITGPTEEILFRGVIQTRLREVFPTASAIVVAALVFSIVHIPAYGAGGALDISLVTTLVVLFVLGAILGTVYEYTGNLVVPAVAHGLYNAVVFSANYVDTVGLV